MAYKFYVANFDLRISPRKKNFRPGSKNQSVETPTNEKKKSVKNELIPSRLHLIQCSYLERNSEKQITFLSFLSFWMWNMISYA